MLKYQKFQAPISKWDVLSKKDQTSWFMQKPNEKLLSFVIILLWEVIYFHFYNWHRPLDLVPVVYDLIELIIEASLWSKDYSTFDTFWIIHLFLRLVLKIFDISTLRVSLWLFEHHTISIQKSLPLFPSQILVYATSFCSS